MTRACDEDGLFWEVLDLEARPRSETELRLRTGMRQVYVFAHAGLLGLAPREPAVALAIRMMDRLRAIAWAPDGRPGWVAKFDRSGKVTDGRHDLYDHAFVLLALGFIATATGDSRYMRWIDETLDVIDEGLAGLHGGWAESTEGELPRRQNPHMHFFEACLALYETTGEARHLARAGELFGLFRSRFLDQKTGILREFFGPEWQVGAAYRSERLEPGHMVEWVWLLRRFQRSTGRRVDETCASLMTQALSIGKHDSGFLVDEADASGHVLSDSRRLWTQTEYLKALVVEAAATGEAAFATQADTLVDRLMETYLTGVPDGCWRDQFTLDGMLKTADIPASTLYHLLVPAVEIGILRERREAMASSAGPLVSAILEVED
jgi:mannose-6-phosphate isomerase